MIDVISNNHGSLNLIKHIGFFKVLLVKANQENSFATSKLVNSLNVEYRDFNLDLNATSFIVNNNGYSAHIVSNSKKEKDYACCCAGFGVTFIAIITCGHCSFFKYCCLPFCEALCTCACAILEATSEYYPQWINQ